MFTQIIMLNDMLLSVKVREARWRLTIDRLKGRVDELTDRCKELEEEVRITKCLTRVGQMG
jgi:predicted nuclease with TOPRIM domain